MIDTVWPDRLSKEGRDQNFVSEMLKWRGFLRFRIEIIEMAEGFTLQDRNV
jgi:hypothetical protein